MGDRAAIHIINFYHIEINVECLCMMQRVDILNLHQNSNTILSTSEYGLDEDCRDEK